MPWKAIPYDETIRERFSSDFKVSGIPKLVVLHPDGHVITMDGTNTNFGAVTARNWWLPKKAPAPSHGHSHSHGGEACTGGH